MSILEILLIAFGLATDSFAVSVSAGTQGTTRDRRSMVRLSFHLGLFQFLMPILGWLAGLSIASYVQAIDHWIAFGLLSWVGIHMIYTARAGIESFMQNDPSRGMMLVFLSVATSLDALAVGISLAMLQISIWYPAVVIGIVTGIISFLGIILGQRVTAKYGKRITYAGGIILILMGIRILIAHIFLV